MGRTILFYDKEDYYDYKEFKNNEGFEIVSLTKYTKNLELISHFDSNSEIIDLSVMTEFTLIQSLAEQIIEKFGDSPIFICDSAKRDKLEYELRFVFDEFKEIDKDSLIKKDREKRIQATESSIEKKHRKIIDLNEDELKQFFDEFNDSLYGHPKFKDDFEEQVRTFKIFNTLKEHKVLSLFLMGDSGVGKTEVARTIFKCLKGEKKFAKINFGNYNSEFSLSSLIGASRGYRDSEDGEIFIKVRDSDVGILLIDEFEKSNTALFNYFLSVLETGIIEGSLAQQIDLNGFIIIFTSNISKEDFQKRISPELRSRFDYKCMFTLLGNEDKKKYLEFRVRSISKKVNAEFGFEIEKDLQKFMSQEIDVSLYSNMRDLNKKIKKKFLEFTIISSVKNEEKIKVEEFSKDNWKRKFLNFFNK